MMKEENIEMRPRARRRGRLPEGARWAWVTGGSGGIGSAISIRLARMGYSVVVCYNRDTEGAQQVVSTIKETGGRAEALSVDVRDGAAVHASVKEWKETHKGEGVEVLVNNAGIRQDGLLVFMEEEAWHEVLDVHLHGFYYITRALLQEMVVRRYGRIINIASVSGICGTPGQVNYSAAKGGLIAASKALALEVAARGVTVNAVAPGFIETRMTADLDPEPYLRRIPMGRFGQVEEVASLVGYLASEEAAYVTGQVIEVNGGLHT